MLGVMEPDEYGSTPSNWSLLCLSRPSPPRLSAGCARRCSAPSPSPRIGGVALEHGAFSPSRASRGDVAAFGRARLRSPTSSTASNPRSSRSRSRSPTAATPRPDSDAAATCRISRRAARSTASSSSSACPTTDDGDRGPRHPPHHSDDGAGLRLLHFRRRLYRHQQPCRRSRHRGEGDDDRRQDARRQGDRHRPEDRSRAAQGQGRRNLPVRRFRRRRRRASATG